MTLSKSAIAHGLLLGATVASAAATAIQAGDVASYVSAGTAALTFTSGVLSYFKLAKAAADVNAVVAAAPALVPLVEAVAPVAEAAVKAAAAEAAKPAK